MDNIISPCIKKCKLIDDRCVGCNRTKQHIIDWRNYTNEERVQIMAELNTGWQCPGCQRMLAPHVNECPTCNKKLNEDTKPAPQLLTEG